MALKLSVVAQKASIREHPLADGEDFEAGAAVLLDGSQEITEAGADPSEILGFALGPANADPFTDKCLVMEAKSESQFYGSGDDDPEESDVGEDYGLAVDGDGIWHVDTSDTSNAVVHIIDVDLERDLYLFKVLEANRQLAG